MKLELTTDQINQILNVLAEKPYIQVHELINTIQQQAQGQLNNVSPTVPQSHAEVIE